MHDFLELLSANSTNPYHALAWAGMGFLISILHNVANRDPLKDGSPTKTNWGWFLSTNIARLFLAVLLILAFVTFSEFLLGAPPSGVLALAIGFGNDKLGSYLTWFTKKTLKKTTP